MLEGFFSPRSVAVIGVSRDPSAVGRRVFENLLAGGFSGPVYPVNPRADDIGGRKVFASVLDIPEPPDLAVVAVPARVVPDVADECGRAGVRALVVLSAGFNEAGPEGGALEHRLVEVVRGHGMRLLGPNCLGLISAEARLNASFAAQSPPPGSIAFMSQSGALGTALLDWSVDTGVGLAAFVSLGNEADVSEADLARVWADDDDVRVVCAYFESVRDGADFIEACSALTARKPMVALKSGRSEAGARAVSSHTGSLAGSDAAYDAAFRRAGVIRARSAEELTDLASGLSQQPPLREGGLAILTNAGGPAVLATDACEALGVPLASLSRATVEALTTALPPAAAVYNPVDVLGDAGAERFADAARTLFADDAVAALLVILTPQAMTDAVATAEAISAAASESGVTTLASFMGAGGVAGGIDTLRRAGIPAYEYPERAVQVVAAMREAGELRSSRSEPVRPAGIRTEVAEPVLHRSAGLGLNFVTDAAAAEVAAAYGIPVPPGGLAHDLGEARSIAAGAGYPVALKVASPDILHKTDVGGVALGVSGPEDLALKYDAILASSYSYLPDAAIWGVYVQKMMPTGREIIVGVDRDPTFGPLLLAGLGGIYVEVLRDVAIRLCPLSEADARDMLRDLRSYSLLLGARGRPPADVDALVDALVRVSWLAVDLPVVAELDINPLIVADAGGGVTAADVRIGIGGM